MGEHLILKMSEIATYCYLVNYQRSKWIENVTIGLVLVFGYILTLGMVEYLWRDHCQDVIIVGSGPLADYFHHLLAEANLKVLSIVPKRESYFTATLNEKPWIRTTPREITFPGPTEEELRQLSNLYSLPLEEVMSGADEMALEAELLPREGLFLGFADKLGARERNLYRYTYPTSHSSAHLREGEVIYLSHQQVTLETGEVLHSRLVCLVEPPECLLEKYINLKEPLGARLEKVYISYLEGKVGTFFQKRDISFSYARYEGQGKVKVSQDIPLERDGGRYRYPIPPDNILEKLDLAYLPAHPGHISNLFFPWYKQEDSPLVLDRLTIPSISPDRDLLIVMQSLRKMLISSLLK
jgi:hypothetical protein